ncbi:MliC family protein [Brumimicrobium mesophilum]|uniref:MliC family protein n=1 Tax=Brumimicrobium mesophilum TaxID=392717 RepID=UPI00131C88D8|nr:MliC family protein [Brumimicrobium mesophilum]
MKNLILSLTVLGLISLTSCSENTNVKSNNPSPEKTKESRDINEDIKKEISDEIVVSTLFDDQGDTLKITFNNTKNIATISFEGNPVVLNGQPAASGIWYKNERFVLRGKGDKVELTKDGKVIFEN